MKQKVKFTQRLTYQFRALKICMKLKLTKYSWKYAAKMVFIWKNILFIKI